MAPETSPASLSSRLLKQVDFRIRNRGERYFSDGAVARIEGDERQVSATVVGNQRYRVKLVYRFSANALLSSCDCGYFTDRAQPCKHIWAAIIAAERRGLLTVPARDNALQIVLAAEDEEEETDTLEHLEPEPARAAPVRRVTTTPWLQRLAALRRAAELKPLAAGGAWPSERQIVYVIDAARTVARGRIAVELTARQRKKSGDWSRLKTTALPHRLIESLPDPADRRIISLLLAPREDYGYSHNGIDSFHYDDDEGAHNIPRRYLVGTSAQSMLVRMMCESGRCVLRGDDGVEDDVETQALSFDDAGPWELGIEVTEQPAGACEVTGRLRRGSESMPLEEPRLIVPGGLLVAGNRVAEFRDEGTYVWLASMRDQGPLQIPAAQRGQLMEQLLNQPVLPPVVAAPESMQVEQVTVKPRVHLRVSRPEESTVAGELAATLWFDYEGTLISATDTGRGLYRAEGRRFVVRDRAAEEEAARLMREVGFREAYRYASGKVGAMQIPERRLTGAVMTLSAAGWVVEAEGKTFRSGGAVRVQVVSGVDWFELHGDVAFGNQRAGLPELLAAIKKGDNAVRLDDGTYGLLPQEWLEQYAPLLELGTAKDGHLQFGRGQLVLLDALLAAQPEATFDETFAQARKELLRFEGIAPVDPPSGFIGELRPYQREGLAWLLFLRRFGFGGCLADDMGLGKTVQVLAMLEGRRELRETERGAERPRPSLAVVPRSLVFNWREEALRFTPNLRVLDHTGMARSKDTRSFDDYDLVLTTYGTLRRDAAMLNDYRFDYVILDEAQTIKNAQTASAKAARLLKADHRLALSGTPVENHLGELWSLLEFLNPGLRGGASLTRLSAAADVSPEARKLLGRAVRPFILRRTKSQVASDLPPKVEQTIHCELEGEQRRLYDELRDHYRRALLPKSAGGMVKSKIQVLEALLRLRQAACHPGLIDKARINEPSAKLEALLPQIAEIVEEGHKVLVFSQFTSMLAIVRNRLDADDMLKNYEYIDGKTRDRAERVDRFQTDASCKLMLISLKAGGLGLNLTAADYVFLLDPWWNPAVEAQAIDRAHRIGQVRHVFAYRLIARDTVEEKVLELQASKRELADAIIGEDNSLLRNLDRDTLEKLLS